jgi:transposase InsO family protein
VDNGCLKSRLMRTGLILLGIRLQAIEPLCPWQNGRIERFFGSLKHALRSMTILGADDLRVQLLEFRPFYNWR